MANLHYVVSGALIRCSGCPAGETQELTTLYSHGVYAKGKELLLITDRELNLNLRPFFACTLQGECLPQIHFDWDPGKEDFLISDVRVLTIESVLYCSYGMGFITFVHGGQNG